MSPMSPRAQPHRCPPSNSTPPLCDPPIHHEQQGGFGGLWSVARLPA